MNKGLTSPNIVFLEEPDYDLVKPKLDAMKSLLNTVNFGFLIIDYYKKDYAFISIDKILFYEYSNEDIAKIGKSNLISQVIPQEELPFLERLQNACIGFINDLPIERRMNCGIYTCHNIMNKNKLIPINMNLTPFILGKHGELWMALATLSLSTKSHEIEAYIEMNDTKERLKFNFKKGCFVSEDYEPLSSKQKEIIMLNSRGYSEVEIGEMLHISVNTVKFHKRNIMRKTKTQNMNEAFVYAYSHKLL
jgi:DNA-binding CsgD family transcriptional regulator